MLDYPLSVSAVATYKITDPPARLFNVDNFTRYIRDQGLEVLKRVTANFASMFNTSGEPTLVNDSVAIGAGSTGANFRRSAESPLCVMR